jgi:N-acetylglucosamine kinase-like BadF-type ATPase
VSPTVFLGVDGGGTKTTFVLVDNDGQIIGSHQGPTSYHLETGMPGLREVLNEGLATVLDRAGIDGSAVAHAFFGLPAYGEDSAKQPLLDAMPEALLGHRRYSCGNDMVCAWAGSLAASDGINVVAGTGSIAYGERQGRSARAGGWGELFGDEGSAYWIAVQALNVFTRMSDGRLPKGPLYAALRTAFDLMLDLDLPAKLMNAQSRSRIAALCQVVTGAARDGDEQAVRILDDAARELAGMAAAVRCRLGFEPDEPVPLSYSGGLFNAGPLILGPLQRHLRQQSGSYRLAPPLLTPALGAALYAAKLAGQPLSRTAVKRLAALRNGN